MLSVHCRGTKQKHSTICRMVSTKHGMDIFEGEANARLIAAAPDMHALLTMAVARIDLEKSPPILAAWADEARQLLARIE